MDTEKFYCHYCRSDTVGTIEADVTGVEETSFSIEVTVLVTVTCQKCNGVIRASNIQKEI